MRSFFTAALLMTALTASAHAEEKPLSKAQIETIVHDYLLAHPEVIIASVEKMQQAQMAGDQEKASKAVTANKAKLQNDAASPVAGNANGDATLVEFFDYNCGYCKKMLPAVTALIAQDKNLRVVYKELPVLAASSELAARWALGVHAVDASKYLPFHSALMRHEGAITEALLEETAGGLGIDAKQVKEKSISPDVSKALEANHALAAALGIRGTPAFAVGKELVPGAVSIDTLKAKIADARSAKK